MTEMFIAVAPTALLLCLWWQLSQIYRLVQRRTRILETHLLLTSLHVDDANAQLTGLAAKLELEHRELMRRLQREHEENLGTLRTLQGR